MEARKREAMLNAVVTLEMTVMSVEGQRKLNQHKPDADHVSVVRVLEQAGGTASAVAQAMRAMRPHLAYSADGGGKAAQSEPSHKTLV